MSTHLNLRGCRKKGGGRIGVFAVGAVRAAAPTGRFCRKHIENSGRVEIYIESIKKKNRAGLGAPTNTEPQIRPWEGAKRVGRGVRKGGETEKQSAKIKKNGKQGTEKRKKRGKSGEIGKRERKRGAKS